MENGILTSTEKDHLKKISIQQHRLAYEITQILRAISPKNVTYVISHRILIDTQDPRKPLHVATEIKEYPEIRVHHAKSDASNEYLIDVDITNLEASE
jgi:hypothetical protein